MIDVVYKGLENFIFMCISGIFVFQIIDDHKSVKCHMLKVQTGLYTSVYYLTNFAVDYTLYMILNIPSMIPLIIGYRNQEIKL